MKNFFIDNKNKIIAGLVIILALTVAFLWGGNYPDSSRNSSAAHIADSSNLESGSNADSFEQHESANSANSVGSENPEASPDPVDSSDLPQDGVAAGQSESENQSSTAEKKPAEDKAPIADSVGNSKSSIDDKANSGKDKYQTEPVPAGQPAPVEPQGVEVSDKEMTCTLSVRCDTILDNMELLNQAKWELVPQDGVIFATTQVTFYDNESVFDLLRREMKKAKIHFEFANTPMYNSAYIEGINNLYEFDLGELSGWMYKVNSWFPNYGSSRYKLKQGDIVELVYTCDLGKDVGGADAAGGQFRNAQ
jgi:hypothetical protein